MNNSDITNMNNEVPEQDKPGEDQQTVIPKTENRQHKKSHAVKPRQPGRLINAVTLTLHTRDAQFACWGNWKAGAVGLLAFARQIERVWKAAAHDDPCADTCLLTVHQALTQQARQFSQKIEVAENELKNAAGELELPPFVSGQPAIRELRFNTPYGFMATRLIAHLDYLLRIFLTAKHAGIAMDCSYSDIKQENMTAISEVFALPFVWQESGITRQDIVDETPLARAQQANQGDVPANILNLTKRAPFAPVIHCHQTESR